MRGGLMVCGTASDVGKSHLVAGLCRMLARNGVSVAPFKAQNMALNSFVTASGHEIGRAQGAQAMAARTTAEVVMNPILLKPTSDTGSQVVLMGRPIGHMSAVAYHAAKPELLAVVLDALADLRSRFDVVICEGAGSPAEINLLDNDIVNLRIAYESSLCAVVVADIDRGGALAALHGTVSLLPEKYRSLVRGFIVNKFRGDPALLSTGLDDLERRCGVATIGVLPYVDRISIDAEDSLEIASSRTASSRTARTGTLAGDASTSGILEHAARAGCDGAGPAAGDAGRLHVAVVRFPRISNFTDLDPLLLEPSVDLRYVERPSDLAGADLIILPGSKATIADLAWMRLRGIDRAIADATRPGTSRPAVVLGICGGYQMLGHRIVDTVESGAGAVEALGHLDIETTFAPGKITRQRSGSALGQALSGYEIHHGRVRPGPRARPWIHLDDRYGNEPEGAAGTGPHAGQHPLENGLNGIVTGNGLNGVVLGTSLHGIFEPDGFRQAFLETVALVRGKQAARAAISFERARQSQFDLWADLIEEHVDTAALAKLIEEPAR